jgi:hypothetical protein
LQENWLNDKIAEEIALGTLGSVEGIWKKDSEPRKQLRGWQDRAGFEKNCVCFLLVVPVCHTCIINKPNCLPHLFLYPEKRSTDNESIYVEQTAVFISHDYQSQRELEILVGTLGQFSLYIFLNPFTLFKWINSLPLPHSTFSKVNYFYFETTILTWSHKKQYWEIPCSLYSVSSSGNILKNYSTITKPGNCHWDSQDREFFHHHKTLHVAFYIHTHLLCLFLTSGNQ